MSIADVAMSIGFVALVAGIAAFDWRVALIVSGLLGFIVGLYGNLRGK